MLGLMSTWLWNNSYIFQTMLIMLLWNWNKFINKLVIIINTINFISKDIILIVLIFRIKNAYYAALFLIIAINAHQSIYAPTVPANIYFQELALILARQAIIKNFFIP